MISGTSKDDFDVLLTQVRQLNRMDGRYPLTVETIAHCLNRMRETIEVFRPFLWEGFDDGYLFEERTTR